MGRQAWAEPDLESLPDTSRCWLCEAAPVTPGAAVVVVVVEEDVEDEPLATILLAEPLPQLEPRRPEIGPLVIEQWSAAIGSPVAETSCLHGMICRFWVL